METVALNLPKISNIEASAAPGIEELPSFTAATATLPKVNNTDDERFGSGEKAVNKVFSSSQPQLNISTKSDSQSQSMHSLNDQSSFSSTAAGDSAFIISNVQSGENREDYSSYSSAKVQNDVNEGGRPIGGRDMNASWRNITQSDDSFTHNQADSGSCPQLAT